MKKKTYVILWTDNGQWQTQFNGVPGFDTLAKAKREVAGLKKWGRMNGDKSKYMIVKIV